MYVYCPPFDAPRMQAARSGLPPATGAASAVGAMPTAAVHCFLRAVPASVALAASVEYGEHAGDWARRRRAPRSGQASRSARHTKAGVENRQVCWFIVVASPGWKACAGLLAYGKGGVSPYLHLSRRHSCPMPPLNAVCWHHTRYGGTGRGPAHAGYCAQGASEDVGSLLSNIDTWLPTPYHQSEARNRGGRSRKRVQASQLLPLAAHRRRGPLQRSLLTSRLDLVG